MLCVCRLLPPKRCELNRLHRDAPAKTIRRWLCVLCCATALFVFGVVSNAFAYSCARVCVFECCWFVCFFFSLILRCSCACLFARFARELCSFFFRVGTYSCNSGSSPLRLVAFSAANAIERLHFFPFCRIRRSRICCFFSSSVLVLFSVCCTTYILYVAYCCARLHCAASLGCIQWFFAFIWP